MGIMKQIFKNTEVRMRRYNIYLIEIKAIANINIFKKKRGSS